MKGINMSSLKGELHHVDAEFAENPALSIQEVDSKLDFCRDFLKAYFKDFSFQKDYHKLPVGAFRNFSFDELCKLRYSTFSTMDDSVDNLFNRRLRYEVFNKIRSSMWRWGCGNGTWNEVVNAWNGIRNFSLGLGPDFETRLDYTRGINAYGNSKFSRTFLDGVFAFLVHYKRKHVMTIGFSIMEGERILIQQVQLKQKSGNRWLYKLPKNRMEFAIDLFAKNFSGFTLYVVDGQSLAEKTLANYKEGLQRAQDKKDRVEYCGADIRENEIEAFQTRIAQLMADSPRLSHFYGDCGKYVLGQSITVNRLIHHKLELNV